MKKTEKSVREKVLPPVKKPEKTPKLVFTGTFYFHGKKKNTAPPSPLPTRKKKQQENTFTENLGLYSVRKFTF